jgi:hypothetical protein
VTQKEIEAMPGPCTLCRGEIKPYTGHLKELCPGCNDKFETLRGHAPSGQAELTGCATEKLNKISSLVNEQLLYIANDKPKMNINGVEYVDQHWVKTTLEDINRILCG